MTLDAQDFIGRFLKHVLPPGFHKIRHFGFLANGRARSSVSRIKSVLSFTSDEDLKNDHETIYAPCPKCETGKLIPIAVFSRFYTVVSISWHYFTNGYALDST